jgi:antitoxin HicB
MAVMDFKVVLEPDPDGGYVAICPSLPGCYSQGSGVEEAMANIREAIELCIEDARERGERLPDPSGTLVGTVLVDV